MDYQKIYDNLIRKRLENPPTEKFERHHIVPRSLGGSDDKDNIVKLTLREHYIAHLLLCKIHRGTRNYYSMLRAFNMMKAGRDGTHIKNSRMFEYFRADFSKAMSEAQSGKNNSNYGKSWYYNPGLDIHKKFRSEDNIPKGFFKGRFGEVMRAKIRRAYINSSDSSVFECIDDIMSQSESRRCERCGENFSCEVKLSAKICIKCNAARIPKINYQDAYHEWLSTDLTIPQFAETKGVTNPSLYTNWNHLNLDYRDEARRRSVIFCAN